MAHTNETQPDYGTGEKKLNVYLFGLFLCSVLTIIAFYTIMSGTFSKLHEFIIIFSAATLQFLIQVVCFLRLNTQTTQGKTNVLCFIFTLVILTTILLGSLWIMSNLNYNMVH